MYPQFVLSIYIKDVNIFLMKFSILQLKNLSILHSFRNVEKSLWETIEGKQSFLSIHREDNTNNFMRK